MNRIVQPLGKVMDALSPEARGVPESGIVEVVNVGRARDGLIPLWVGEGDLPTPDLICDAAKASLDAGETFYTYQRGIPELRSALADYHESLYRRAFSPERFFVTGSGMQSIQIAVACVASAGDEVIVPTPAWPNLAAAVEIRGAKAVPVAMSFSTAGWTLDVQQVIDQITPKTRAIFLNSPCNPTGWVASETILVELLQAARKAGIWIIADEIYARFFYRDEQRGASFYDVSDPDDRIIYVNSFSKNWAMTGWRVGWLSAPPELGQVIENLIQYSTSGVPVFNQRAAVAALRDGGTFVEAQLARAAQGRQIVLDHLSASSRFRFGRPDGAFYMFFGIDGFSDSRNLALDLVRETGVGLAPGSAFGAAGEGYLRLCFARNPAHLDDALGRIVQWTEGR